VPGIGIRIGFGSSILLASSTSQSLITNKDKISLTIPPLINSYESSINIRTILELTSGSTVLTSSPISLSYNPPLIDKVFTYEGESAALRVVVTGGNFCGGLPCGAVELLDMNNNPVAVSRYITYTHDRVEMEMDTDKGQLRIAVGSASSGYQYSSWKTFNHMSPVIDNKNMIALQTFSTIGGDIVTIQGRYFRKTNVELWVGTTKGSVISVTQDSERGPHFYTVIGTVPEGQGLVNPLYIKLPSTGGSITDAESEPAYVNYKAPSQLSINVHHFPTTGGQVIVTGLDLGLCAILLVDGVKVGGNICNPSTNAVTRHVSVSLRIPDGEGRGHVLSLSVGDQIVPSTLSGWKSVPSQCSNGKGLENKFGWFDYDPPIVKTIAPPTISTIGGSTITITGKNFGTTPPSVTLHNRNPKVCKSCQVTLKEKCLAGFGCITSKCCGATSETLGCGCYNSNCECCVQASICKVISSTHTSIMCIMSPGQGKDLEVTVASSGQSSADGTGSTPALFSYLPPSIASISPLKSTSKGGDTITIRGSSFGLSGATITLLGDGLVKDSPLSSNIGPFDASFQNHTMIQFVVPEGHGNHRTIQVTVGGQSTAGAQLFHYDNPTFNQLEQPIPCNTRVRTTACGSPTQGGFKIILHGKNLGTTTTSGASVTIGKNRCCIANKKVTGKDDCSTVGSALSVSCSCCVESHSHEKIVVRAPPGAGANVPLILDYSTNYRGWRFQVHSYYDPPYVNFINPQMGNANGGDISLHGINFGNVYDGGNVSSITIGNNTCTNIRWTGTGPTDEAVTCTIGKDTSGPKDVSIIVATQESKWSKNEWKTSVGHRLYFAECPPSFYGRVDEPCFECPYVTDNDGVIVRDNRGDKQYMATCLGGDTEPTAKKGFYKSYLYRQCGDNKNQICTNSSQCDDGIECSFKYTAGAEYCNEVQKSLRTSCSYVLSCKPAEACNANNLCSVVGENEVDPVTGKTLDPHGYANTTMSGIPVERCSECARGYFRVGGRCEICPTDILLLAILFICGIIGLSVAGYVMHIFKVNLAMAAIGIDYAQVMSMFLKSDIRWPSEIRSLFRLMSSFNFDLDVASPECLVQEYYRYDIKWYVLY
jgi:hypothetical protein